MTRDEFLEEVKKLGFPVLVQGVVQLAQRREEPLEDLLRDEGSSAPCRKEEGSLKNPSKKK